MGVGSVRSKFAHVELALDTQESLFFATLQTRIYTIENTY